MSTFYENIDLINLADKVVKELYRNKDIYNYVHNGKQIPVKYEKIIQRPIQCSNIDNYKSLQTILTNAIRYSFNQNTQLNTTIAHEYRIYRETCERNKITLLSLKKKKSLGDKSVDIDIDIDIEKKEKEIKLLQSKIDEIANITNTKPEFNKNILTLAEEAYLLLIRIDKTPYYFYAEICKKLGIRVNLDQQFPGFREKDKEKDKRKRKEDDDENEDYRNFLDMNVKKGVYVPPSLRKDIIVDDKVNKINKLNYNKQNISLKNDLPNKESFPELSNLNLATNNVNLATNNVNLATNNVNLATNMWAKRPNIIPDIVKEVKKEETGKELNKQNNIDNKTVQTIINKEEYVFSTSWEEKE